MHEQYMKRCVQLAKLAKGHTGLNPLVGSVLVHQGRIIGEGYHKKYGQAHAEVNCLVSVKKEDKKIIPKSTLYVSLEPCNHHGKTPPCSHAIVTAGIKQVVIGTTDPNPQVNNSGINHLQNNGIQITQGICKDACKQLNKIFFTNQIEKRSFVKLKWAQSSNGIIGSNDEQLKISSAATNIINHKYRTQADAILVGFRTALQDKPMLNVRHWKGPQPARIFIDRDLALPHEIVYNKNSRNIVLNNHETKQYNGVEYVQVELAPLAISQKLLTLGIGSVLVEGGAKTHEQFIQQNVWDEAIIINSSSMLNGDVHAATLNKATLYCEEQTATDKVQHYINHQQIN